MTKQRNSSFELVRILCIFFAIYWHSINPYLNDLPMTNFAPANLINTIINNTNLLFMLLSGYFGIRFNLEKLIKLDLAIIFYDVLYLFLFGTLGLKSLVTAFMPITFKSHWFLTCYFAIAILSGFLNKIPEKLERKTFRNLLLVLLFIFFVMPTVFFSELIEDGGKGVVCMSILYLTGRYIRLYYSDRTFKKGRLAILFWAVTLFTTALNFAMSILKGTFFGMYCRDNSIFIVITAVAFFLFFKEMHFTNRLINHLAPNVVILYCIEGYAREIFDRFIDMSVYADSIFFVLIAAVYAICVLTACLLLNEIRRLLFDRLDTAVSRLIMKPVNFMIPHLQDFYEKAHARLVSFIEKGIETK